MADLVAVAVLGAALVLPNEPGRLTPWAFVRLPAEGIALLGLSLALSRRTTRGVAWVVGPVVGLLTVLKVVQLAYFGVIDRAFNIVTDVGHLRSGVDFVRVSVGSLAADGAVVGAVLLAVVLVVAVTWSVRRVTGAGQRDRRRTAAFVVVLCTAWAGAALTGLRVGPAEPVAAVDTVRFVVGQARSASTAVRDQRRFDAAVRVDAYERPRVGDLAALRGKDVVVAFVESYGRAAVQGDASSGVRALLDGSSRRLESSGYSARSAFLTSPTFGGVSWLAHATLQSGVWVDNQASYDRLLSGRRTSLSGAFGRAGWRTVALLPSNRGAWPQGRTYYGFDAMYDSSDLGYAGPRFGFSSMPDQYVLEALQRRELAVDVRPPVMAEVELASSHGPWAPVPIMVPWDELGDGSVFDAIHGRAESAAELWSHRDRVPAAYMASIEYSLDALVSFVERYGDDRLVLVLLGDHQPATIVSGFDGNRDVPVTVVARDPAVLAAVSGGGWQSGMRPGPGAPVWRMDTFRDRFLDTFSDRAAPRNGEPR